MKIWRKWNCQFPSWVLMLSQKLDCGLCRKYRASTLGLSNATHSWGWKAVFLKYGNQWHRYIYTTPGQYPLTLKTHYSWAISAFMSVVQDTWNEYIKELVIYFTTTFDTTVMRDHAALRYMLYYMGLKYGWVASKIPYTGETAWYVAEWDLKPLDK